MTRAASTVSPTVLTIVEAVELSTAWLQHLASSLDIKSLVLKGSTLSRQGLRDPHLSADVDVIVDPDHVGRLIAAVEGAGWSEFASTFAGEQFTSHSKTFRREGWPNSVDIHSSWPGFLESDRVVFDLMWSRRQSLDFAGISCAVPDRATNILVLALHSLRGSQQQTRHERELARLLKLDLTSTERVELAELARGYGADGPLSNVLSTLGVTASPARRSNLDHLEWHRKIVQKEVRGRVALWIIELRRAPWRRKAVVLRHGVWPTDHDLLAEHPDVPDRFWSKIWARIARLGGGIRQLPRVIPALRRR